MAGYCYADLPNLAQVEKENLQLKITRSRLRKIQGYAAYVGSTASEGWNAMCSSVQHGTGKAQG